jgi:hypothetical protein
MKRLVKATALGLGLMAIPWMSSAQDRVVAPGATVEKLAGDFKFTEGPTCDADGNLQLHRPLLQANLVDARHDAADRAARLLPVRRPPAVRARHRRSGQAQHGIIGTPDGKKVYVADIGAGRTYRYDIAPDGGLTHKTLVVEHGSDGMTLDNEGNLDLTGKGVLVFDPTGRQVEQIPVPDDEWTANVSFCGKDRQTLFITASTGVYGVRMRVKGANAAK